MTAARAERERRYRKCGWWRSCRLASRYAEQVRGREHALAVADATGRELSHGELRAQAAALASALAEHGVGPDDPVLIVLPNGIAWQVTLLAVLELGAIAASMPATSPAAHITHALELVHARVVVTGPIAGAAEADDACREAVASRGAEVGLARIDEAGQACWERAPGAPQRVAGLPERVDHIAFTSSTTGLPKAVAHSDETLGYLNQAFSDRFGLGPDDPIFMAAPLGHSVGAYHGARLALYNGASLVLQQRWDPVEALALVERYGCAFTAAATPFLKDLVDAALDSDRGAGFETLRAFLCGGAPVPPVLLERAAQAFPATFVTNLWGMTEGGLITSLPDSPRDKVVETAGVGLPGLELAVVDEAGHALPPGREGELVMRGPGVFIGYVGQSDLYEASHTGDDFFRTGDLATIDEDGYVRITGRLKDLIIRGGVNLSPIPIEDVLARHPAVRSVAVIGWPDERLGERICAVIEAAGDPPTFDEILEFATAEGLTKRQLPEMLRVVEAMPRTPSGKIRKADLERELTAAGSDRRSDHASCGASPRG